MTEIRHIVFDIGKVLVKWERDRPYRELIPDDAERQRFLDEICTMEWHMALDEGTGIDAGHRIPERKFPHEAERIKHYKSNWLASIPGPIEGTVEILEALIAQGRDVTALTNFNQDLFRVTQEAYPFLSTFRGITVSGEKRMVKPDPAIYAHHAEAFGLEPAATLFFDDSPPNIESARAAGWNAELFTDAGQMRADLEKYGITV
jgi:HAD superfamily hydrolase (TIGR01509 family)